MGRYKNNAERRKAARDRKSRREGRLRNELTGPIIQGQHVNGNPQHATIMNDIRKKHLRMLGLSPKEYNEMK